MEILSRELGIPMTAVTKKGTGSNMLVGKIKEDL
jgi:glycerol-3-phosphate dehydrogenase